MRRWVRWAVGERATALSRTAWRGRPALQSSGVVGAAGDGVTALTGDGFSGGADRADGAADIDAWRRRVLSSEMNAWSLRAGR